MESASMQCQRRVIQGDTVEYWDSQSDKPVLMLIHGFGATTRFQRSEERRVGKEC